MIFGLVPALLLLRTQFTTDLKAGERGSSKGARRIYSVLVAAEVAMACALLVSSALLVRTVGRMMETPTGVNADECHDLDGAAVAVGGRRAGARRHDRNRVGAGRQRAHAHPRRDPRSSPA